MVKFKKCKLFDKTLKKYRENKLVMKKLVEFLKLKNAEPTRPFGSTDYKFTGNPRLRDYWHAHTNHDVSIIYRVVVSGGVTTFYLYGLFSHDDLGTGTPPSKHKQDSTADRLDTMDIPSSFQDMEAR